MSVAACSCDEAELNELAGTRARISLKPLKMAQEPLVQEVAILPVGSHICRLVAEPQVGMRRVNSLDFVH